MATNEKPYGWEQWQIEEKPEPDGVWFQMRITKRQLHFLELLCKFHRQLSGNDLAKEDSRKLLSALRQSPKQETPE